MRFAHTNIAAKNWKSLSEFYIKVFDCKIKPPERKLSGAWLDRATGLQDAVLEGVHLLLPGHGNNGPTLEIFSYQEMHDCNPTMANHIGITHIAFEVHDVDQTLDVAIKNGGQVLGQVVEKTVAGVGELKFVYFRDPEGNIVEIQSWKKQAPRTTGLSLAENAGGNFAFLKRPCRTYPSGYTSLAFSAAYPRRYARKDIMPYTIQAIISNISIQPKLEDMGLPCVDMPFDMAMFPLTHDYVEKKDIPFLPLTDDGGTSIGDKLKNLCAKLSESNKVAYIDAEYFGGEGIQACNLYWDGVEFEQLLISSNAINHALHWLGIERTDEIDEFDNFGLGTHRNTEDWINKIA